MTPAPDRHALRDRFADALLAAARPLQVGPDPEVALDALIDAAGLVQERLRQEPTPEDHNGPSVAFEVAPAWRTGAGFSGRIPGRPAPPRMMPNGWLGSPAIVSLRS
jgi:hypothetical protein